MFTAKTIRNLMISAQNCDTFKQYFASECDSFPRNIADSDAEKILRVIYDGRDDGLDPLAIRELSGMSRAKFSREYAIPVRTLENWECDGTNSHTAPEYLLELLTADVLNRTYEK